MIKQRAKSKTYNFGMAITILGVVESQAPYMQDFFGQYYGFFVMAIGIGICILRERTNQALKDK